MLKTQIQTSYNCFSSLYLFRKWQIHMTDSYFNRNVTTFLWPNIISLEYSTIRRRNAKRSKAARAWNCCWSKRNVKNKGLRRKVGFSVSLYLMYLRRAMKDWIWFPFLSCRFPLFTAIHLICKGEIPASQMVDCIRNHPEHM